MKILMLTPYLPYPPSSGGQVRSYNLLKNLGKRHQIHLFSLIKSEEEKKYIGKLKEFCHEVQVFERPPKPWSLKNILRTGFGVYPFLVIRNLSPQEKWALSKKLSSEKFDLIHAETFYVMPHIPPTKTPILLVDQTVEYKVYQHFVDTFHYWFLRPLLYLDVAKLKFWEKRFWEKANKVVAVSESDKQEMLSLSPGLDVEIIPNGAGEDLFKLWNGSPRERKKPIILYQGNFFWLQNIEAAEFLAKKVFPLIKEKIKDASCWIVGQEAQDKIGHLAGEGIRIIDLKTDEVAAVKKAYGEATVFLAPLFGPGGTRLKILGAMAAGVPVVTTQIGIMGIAAQNGEEALIENSPQGMAKAIIRLVKDPVLYGRIAQKARKLVEEKYNYEKISQKLEKIYGEVAYGNKS